MAPANGLGVATIDVADFPTTAVLDQVDATVSITHPNTSQLNLYLVSPDGTRVALAQGRSGGGSTANFTNTTFTDNAQRAISDPTSQNPYSGSYQPEQPMASFADIPGTSVNGVWRLEVINNSGVAATITGFQLALTDRRHTRSAPRPDSGQCPGHGHDQRHQHPSRPGDPRHQRHGVDHGSEDLRSRAHARQPRRHQRTALERQ